MTNGRATQNKLVFPGLLAVPLANLVQDRIWLTLQSHIQDLTFLFGEAARATG